jgi:glycosyltransferase involved in cell wall biosynthesis
MYYPGVKGKTTMIPHGLYHPGSTKAPGLPGQQDPDSLRYILFAGFIRESKGLEYLLEAFNRINHQHNVYLIIAGTVQEPQLNKDRQTYQKEMKYFQTLQSSTGKNDKIIYLNRFLPVEELNWLLLHAELVVFPYLDCSQSGMFHRALGYGKPIVASSVGNFAEVIENGVNGLLVSPKNSRELHHAIGNVLSDTDLGKQLKDSLAKNPIPGIEEISHRYYHLYQRVMEK